MRKKIHIMYTRFSKCSRLFLKKHKKAHRRAESSTNIMMLVLIICFARNWSLEKIVSEESEGGEARAIILGGSHFLFHFNEALIKVKM